MRLTDSPYTVVVQDDPLVDVRGRGVESVPVRQPAQFTIDASNALFAANPLVIITGLQSTTTITRSLLLLLLLLLQLQQHQQQQKLLPLLLLLDYDYSRLLSN